uniref:BZIP domain-containing protein n=1 Tax=Cairina moschata TaxID=8855 RepID=A0A8C3BF32_CAIMO
MRRRGAPARRGGAGRGGAGRGFAGRGFAGRGAPAPAEGGKGVRRAGRRDRCRSPHGANAAAAAGPAALTYPPVLPNARQGPPGPAEPMPSPQPPAEQEKPNPPGDFADKLAWIRSLLAQENIPNLDWLNWQLDELLLETLGPFLDMVELMYISKLPGYKSGVSGVQSLPQSPSSAPDSNTQSSDVVQGDHSSSPQEGWPAPERSVRADTGEGDVSINPEPWMGQQSMDVAVQQSTSFPVGVNVDAGPQPMPEATMQPALPEVVLPAEGNQLLENKGAPLQTGQQLNKAEERLPKKACCKMRSHKLALERHRKDRIYMVGLENRVAACTAQNRALRKKMQLLQKDNVSLMEQLNQLQAVVQELTTTGTTARHPPPAWQAAHGKQEEAVPEELNTEPEGTSLLGSLNPLWGEGQSLPVPNLAYAFNTGSSSVPAATVGSELGPPQLQGAALLQPPLGLGVAVAMQSQEAGVEEVHHQHLYPVAAPHQGDETLAPCFLPAGVRPGTLQSHVGRESVTEEDFKSSRDGW